MLYPVNRLIEKKILTAINRLVHVLIDMSCVSEEQKGPYFQEAVELIRDTRPYLLSLIEGKEVLLESLLRQLISQKLPHPSVLRSFGDLQRDLNRIIHAALHNSEEDAAGTATETGQPQVDASANGAAEKAEDVPGPIETAAPVANDTADAPSDTGTASAEESPDETASVLPPEEMETATKIEEPAVVPVDTYAQKPKPEEPPDLLQNIISSIYGNEVIIKDYVFKTLPLNYYFPLRKTAIITSDRRKTRLHDLFLKKEGITVCEITPEECRSVYLLSRKLPRF